MKNEIISQLHSSFELAVNETDGVEYWFARDLKKVSYHFAAANKMVLIHSGYSENKSHL